VSRVPTSYFEKLYRDDPDPWGFATRWYETRKYQLTLAALPHPRYRSAFEPGCSIGVLTELLAARCDYVLAGDEILEALDQARARTTSLANVKVERLTLPEDWPSGPFDLVVLSEVAYYFDEGDLDRLLGRCLGSLEPGGSLIAVHWRGPTDYPLAGDETHTLIDARPCLTSVVHHREDEFVLDVWERTAT
jgi:SAM-dependent methyltransferase